MERRRFLAALGLVAVAPKRFLNALAQPAFPLKYTKVYGVSVVEQMGKFSKEMNELWKVNMIDCSNALAKLDSNGKLILFNKDGPMVGSLDPYEDEDNYTHQRFPGAEMGTFKDFGDNEDETVDARYELNNESGDDDEDDGLFTFDLNDDLDNDFADDELPDEGSRQDAEREDDLDDRPNV